jgi:hypothetical protein
MWEVEDPEGRRVILTIERWQHVVTEHEQLADRRGLVLAAVRRPDVRMSGRKPGEEWYYRRTGEPTRWLKVVVHYVDGFGRIVTAFPRRRLP